MDALTPVRPVLRPIHALASFRMNSGTHSNRSPRFTASAFRPFRLQPSGVACRRFFTLPLSSTGSRFRGLGFATGMPAFPYHQTESSSFPTDWMFASSCFPPHLTVTQLLLASGRRASARRGLSPL